MRGIVMLLAGLLPICAVRAEVYRCVVDGQARYTDQPCGAGASPHALPALSSVPAAPESDLAEAHDERRKRETKTRRQDDEAWLEAHAQRKSRAARMDAAIAEGKVLKDMDANEVRRALGSPDEVERGAGAEEWVYGSGKQRRTVRFEGGRVVKQTGKK